MTSPSLDLQNLPDQLAKAKTVLILLPSTPATDAVAAGLALYLSLKEKKINHLTIASPTPMTVGLNRLFAVDKITTSIGNRNLVISFDYVKDAIEKVSYNIENQKFNLVIEPKPGFPPLDPQKVSYSYSGADADLLFVIGARRLTDLGNFYQEEKQLFEKKPLINIAPFKDAEPFGQLNLTDPAFSSCSELVARLLFQLQFPINPDIATNLLAGIESATARLSSPQVTAQTLRLVADLLEKGGKRNHLAAPPLKPLSSPPPSSLSSQPQPSPQPPSPDWYQPKIYKGDTQV